MLTPERLTALTAIRNGEVTAKHGARGQYTYAPMEFVVAIGFLIRAGLVQRDGKVVEVTERGEHALTATGISS